MPLRRNELPRAYHLLWLMAVILIAASVYRWYLGMEWYGILPGIGIWVGSIAVILGLAVYFGWLWRAARCATA
jgi:hypothetical protein